MSTTPPSASATTAPPASRRAAGRGVALGWRPLIDDLAGGAALVVVGPEVRSDRGHYVTWRQPAPSRAVASLVDWLPAQADPITR